MLPAPRAVDASLTICLTGSLQQIADLKCSPIGIIEKCRFHKQPFQIHVEDGFELALGRKVPSAFIGITGQVYPIGS